MLGRPAADAQVQVDHLLGQVVGLEEQLEAVVEEIGERVVEVHRGVVPLVEVSRLADLGHPPAVHVESEPGQDPVLLVDERQVAQPLPLLRQHVDVVPVGLLAQVDAEDVGVRVVRVDAEARVPLLLPGDLDAHQLSVAAVDRRFHVEAVERTAALRRRGDEVEVVDALEEHAAGDDADVGQEVLDEEVEVVRDRRIEVRIAAGDLLVVRVGVGEGHGVPEVGPGHAARVGGPQVRLGIEAITELQVRVDEVVGPGHVLLRVADHVIVVDHQVRARVVELVELGTEAHQHGEPPVFLGAHRVHAGDVFLGVVRLAQVDVVAHLLLEAARALVRVEEGAEGLAVVDPADVVAAFGDVGPRALELAQVQVVASPSPPRAQVGALLVQRPELDAHLELAGIAVPLHRPGDVERGRVDRARRVLELLVYDVELERVAGVDVHPRRVPARRLAADIDDIQVVTAGLELGPQLAVRLLGVGGTRRQAEVEQGHAQPVLAGDAVGRALLLLEPVVQGLDEPQALDLRGADVVAPIPADPRDLPVLVVLAIVLHDAEVELVVVVDADLEARVRAVAVAIIGRELHLRVGQGIGDLDPADGVFASPPLLVVVALGRGAGEVDADREPEVLVPARHGRVVERGARVGAVGDRVVADAQGEVRHAVRLVERAPRLQIDRAADRVGVHVRGQDLGHLDAGELRGRDDVELDHPVLRVRVADLVAVHRHVGHRRGGASHGDEPAFTAVALDADAGDALQHFRRVQVGEALDLLLGEDVLDVDRLLLVVQRLALPEPDGLHDDLVGELVPGVELDRQGHRSRRGHRDAGLEILETDVVHDQGVVARGHAVEPVAAVAARSGLVLRVLERDLGTRKQGARFLLRDRALDGWSGLGPGRAGADEHCQCRDAGKSRKVRESLFHGAVSPKRSRYELDHPLSKARVSIAPWGAIGSIAAANAVGES